MLKHRQHVFLSCLAFSALFPVTATAGLFDLFRKRTCVVRPVASPCSPTCAVTNPPQDPKIYPCTVYAMAIGTNGNGTCQGRMVSVTNEDCEIAKSCAAEEAENALVAFLKTQQRVRSLKESVEQAKTALERTTEKYVAGAADFNRVFNLEELLVRQQDQLARSEGDIALNLIALYKALRGGWNVKPSTHFIAPPPTPDEYEEIPRGEAVELNEVLPNDQTRCLSGLLVECGV